MVFFFKYREVLLHCDSALSYIAYFEDHTAFLQRQVRSINSNVWIAQRNDWPVPNSPNSTWEWYFATVSFL